MKMKTLGSSRLRVNVTVNAAYFYVGTSGAPSAAGATRLRDERGGSSPLRKYRGEGINFGDVRIPAGVEFPKPARVGALRGVHGVSSDAVVVVDAQTLLFWVGRGAKPSPAGVRIPDENGKEAPLRKYDRKTIVLTLPGELTVFDIGHFGVWCEAFTVDFGHVALPREQLANIPPSLKMLGVSPQSRNKALAASPAAAPPPSPRRPIARLDATTYRPARLGAGPLAALLDQPADHAAHLHRRADDYRPPINSSSPPPPPSSPTPTTSGFKSSSGATNNSSNSSNSSCISSNNSKSCWSSKRTSRDFMSSSYMKNER
ncbi:hypothetical protein MSG28_014033 [Choristoneura fumiferana]|uniref:Uncharacterized protein n=1 Tax=Choristoneura fumiferana TaxID=7141 RepID=A0ACC0JFQ5_CHOFU|nr:hypothetical protein MSG28_014033 [Choristoneura fumiferana]